MTRRQYTAAGILLEKTAFFPWVIFLRYIVGKTRKIARVSLHSWNSYEIFLEVCLLWIDSIQVQFQFLNDMDITPGNFEIQGFETTTGRY